MTSDQQPAPVERSTVHCRMFRSTGDASPITMPHRGFVSRAGQRMDYADV